MKAEIIAIGTELLLGQIVNTNAQFISQQCASMGIDIYFQTVVGDNDARLRQTLDIAKNRAELIICTGGLGPTQDDLTKDVLADYIGRELSIHQPSMDKITALFQARGVHMVESNARQATIIAGSDPLTNDTGLAVGNALTYEGVHYLVLPGPPKEMKPMFENYAKPWLLSVMKEEVPLFSKMLKFCGIGESNLEHQLLDLIKEQQDPTLAPYAKEGEVAIRLTTRAHSQAEAFAKMESTEKIIHERLGQYLYAEEDITLEKAIVSEMAKKNIGLAVAESCSGGLFSDLITSIPGSSEVFHGGLICYSNELKHSLLGVPRDIMEGEGAPGAVSAEAAQIMAERLLQITATDLAVSITGVAGPATSEGKPVGLVYVGIAQKNKATTVTQVQHWGTRELIKLKAVKSAQYQLWLRLKEM